jgi:two-component system, NarL family, nitrate/nitrite response regulator NarL
VKTVVVCDQHLLFGEAFGAALRRRGAHATVTSQPEKMLAILAERRVTSVVMNVHAPPSGGLDATRQIRRCWPDTHVYCLAPEEPGLMSACMEAGAHLVLSKKQPLGDLVRSVMEPPETRRGPSLLGQGPVRGGPASGRDVELPLAARFLTRRERDVLRLLTSAESTSTIARKLGISETTTRGYIQSTFIKLGVHSRVEAVTYALRNAVV